MYRSAAIVLAIAATTLPLMTGCTAMMLSGGGASSSPGMTERDRPATGRSATGQSATGDESAVSATIRSRFRADADLGSLGLGVQASGGQVVLSGSVPTYALRDKAYRLARQVDGVDSVVNQIQVRN